MIMSAVSTPAPAAGSEIARPVRNIASTMTRTTIKGDTATWAACSGKKSSTARRTPPTIPSE